MPRVHPMLTKGTPLEDHTKEYGIWVKREDLACYPPGPPFSKTRGVYARVKSRPERLIGVLDTYHSQAGHAVARACQVLGKKCVAFYPHYKADTELRQPQIRAVELGAELKPLPAGRSCILFHAAKKETLRLGGYMMPNALKLEESVQETASEVTEDMEQFSGVVIPVSSGTIAAGVILGFLRRDLHPVFWLHLGYSRSEEELRRYVVEYVLSRFTIKNDAKTDIRVIDEGYSYRDESVNGPTPPWPCNRYYDLKAFRWVQKNRSKLGESVLFWNIG